MGYRMQRTRLNIPLHRCDMGLEKVTASITQLSSSPSSLTELTECLKAEDKSLDRSKHLIPAALDSLDPVRHSYGYLWLLEKIVSAQSRDPLERTLHFLRVCEAEQIRLSPAKFARLCQKARELALQVRAAKPAILPLLLGLQKLAPSADYITGIHAPLFQLCLQTKCYSAALPALNLDACEVDPGVTGLTCREFLLYCYYGARILIGRRRYPEALQLLCQALTAPTMVVNAITVAAYKKYVLVSLVHAGRVPMLPKFTNSVVLRAVKSECGKYNDILQNYAKPDAAFDKVVNKAVATIKKDGNLGLLRLALEARTKRAIQRLTQTYLTLSLGHIAQNVGLPSADEAELCILRMIDAGDIFAAIDDSRGMVHFLEDPEEYGSARTAARLDAQMEQAMTLATKLRDTDEKLACDKAWLSKTGSRDRQRQFEEGAAFDAEPSASP